MLMASAANRRSAGQQLCTIWLLAWLVLLIYGFMISTLAQQLRPNTDLANPNESGICKSLDIRNTISSFESLRGCKVVEGFVQILLFDNVNKSSFSNVSFPELTEITDYLLLYRVSGLVSLGQLFPNLSVIRGQTLLFGNALIIYEMSSLQEINLYSLTDISKGVIRIEKNPSLCYVNSIDWSLIATEHDHFIQNVKSENECPLCPGDEGETENICPLARPKLGRTDYLQKRHLCWNRQHCQKVCPENCKACDENGKCCDEKCLGGCSARDRSVCHVCQNFTMGSGENRKCLTHCPQHLYQYLGRRCVTQEECFNVSKSVDHRVEHEFPYKIYNKSCVLNCPDNYMDNYSNRTCIPCEGKCKKKCPGTNVDNLASAQQLRGCTHINGSLEIQIRGGRNIVTELEENLKLIEEIDGYLKVVRSFPLISLNFLKNLKRIRGNVLESQKYVFVVLDNQNLQDLWDFTNRTLTINRGQLFFHFNPKLCMEKIKKLKEIANMPEYTEVDVASTSNGDKTACHIENLEVHITQIQKFEVTLEWKPFKIHDFRKLLAYLVFSIEAPSRNVTLYDSRDACGGDGWRVNDFQPYEDHPTYLLTGLKPFMQYAIYVKTYTIATEQTGAQSKIYYFTTRASQPTAPVSVQVTSNNSDSLVIKWGPPRNPNGLITYYTVTGKENESNEENDRDYCNGSYDQKVTTVAPDISATLSKPKTNETCSCETSSQRTGPQLEENIISQITFEDMLQNKVYIKKDTSKERSQKTKRQVFEKDITTTTDKSNVVENITSNGTETFESFHFNVTGDTELYVNKLHHFTWYSIHISACRNKEKYDQEGEYCSPASLTDIRTLKKVGADDIVSGINITNQNLSSITITWDEPSDPNGKILNYQIEYKRLDIENYVATPRCINSNTYLKNGKQYVLSGLNSGNYSLRVKAVSQAGEGEFTSYVYFYINEPSSSSVNTILYITGFLAVILIIVFVWFRKRYQSKLKEKLIPKVNPDYISTQYLPDDWEVPRKKIDFHKELGQGSFGMVYEGIARDIRGKAQIRCAIKTVNEHATNRERIEFLNEASVMKAFDTAHVVKLLGVVSMEQPTLVVMELMANGDLKSYLRSHRPEGNPTSIHQPPTLKRILQMAIEIGDGMAYLSAKKFVHRDLAARNCMVAEDLTVKIGDFGMTRDIYETDYYRKGTKGLLPVRWMAPESLKDGVFASSSDVWSYGVVLWEMATLALQPYQGLSNDQVLRYVIDGGIMERPENCPDKLYFLMQQCWKHKPSERPTFLDLCSSLLGDASPSFMQVSFYDSVAGREARALRSSQSACQDDPTIPLRLTHNLKEKFSLNSSEEADFEPDELLENEIRMDFPSFPLPKDSSNIANGYLGANASNGTTAN